MTAAFHLLARPILFALSLAHPPGPGEAPPPPPPPEAIEACEGADSGDACSFSGREGEEVSGTCFAPEDDLPLACKPDHPPPPPPES